MPSKDEAFGPFVLDEEVQEAIVTTLKKWLPTYLAVIEQSSRQALPQGARDAPRSSALARRLR
jgi:hypothetical protein